MNCSFRLILKGIDTGFSLPVKSQWSLGKIAHVSFYYIMPRILTKMKNFGKYLRATHHLYFQTSFLRRTVDWIIKTNRVTISWSWMKVIHLFYFILATSYSTFKVSVMSGYQGYQPTAFENHSYLTTKLLCSIWCHFRSKLHACRYKTL